ncbi:MAG: hypothetical protein H6657_25520 [Ardenticatenaceae bacterium]|nr:hypothetical protein [Ardenticatenaceae bacterium]
MNRLSFNQRVEIQGPFWRASVRIVQIEDPTQHWGLRTIFVDQTPRTAFNQANLLLPGTLLIVARVNNVVIEPAANVRFGWQKGEVDQPATNLSRDEVLEGLAQGHLTLLLVNADPSQWNSQTEASPLPIFNCLGGLIRLDVLTPKRTEGLETDETLFYRALGLTKAVRQESTPYYLHASGITLYGQRIFPWETSPFAAPFRLLREFAEGNPLPRYRLDVDEPLLTSTEQTILIKSWQAFHQLLNPGFPSEKEPVADGNHPVWTSLEIVNPLDIPRLYWPITNWKAGRPSGEIRFHPEAFNLLLSDANPYDPALPPSTTSRIILDEMNLEKSDDHLLLQVSSASSNDATPGVWQYTAQKTADSWSEAVEIKDIQLSYPTTQVAARIRSTLDIPTPEWTAGMSPLSPTVLWGNMAIEGGWFQFPFLNLTQQIYVEAEVVQFQPPDKKSGTNVMRGALALSNRQARKFHQAEREQPWDVVLSNYAQLKGVWTINLLEKTLTSIEITLTSPRLDLNGFIWLSYQAPTLADGLPTLSDWPRALQSLSLSNLAIEKQTFPASVNLELPRLTLSRQQGEYIEQITPPEEEEAADPEDSGDQDGTPATGSDSTASMLDVSNNETAQNNSILKRIFFWAKLGTWTLEIQTETPVFSQFVAAGLLSADAYAQFGPLLWLSHPTLPVIQALSLTENRLSPHDPSPNRALMPFQPVTNGAWLFGSSNEEGAAHWPKFLSEIEVANEWAAVPDLPIVYLSLPGIVATPTDKPLLRDPLTGLALSWRHDIPLTDQIYALAKLSQDSALQAAVLGNSPETLETPRQPLQRETFADYWQELSVKTSLARVDQDEEPLLLDDAALRFVIEPYTWPVTIEVDTSQYPGRLNLGNRPTTELPSLSLADLSLLRGLSGAFGLIDGQLQYMGENGANNSHFQLTAGSMAAYAENGRYRDQRGWWRSATQTQPNLLMTNVSLDGLPENWQLTTTRQPIQLETGGGVSWTFWFKDLPILIETFDRRQVKTPLNEDNNDPEALSRRYNMLNGYEWRLGQMGLPAENLSLFGCRFFPLTLESVQLDEGQLQNCLIKGRLQLPLATYQDELETGQTTVLLEFARQGEENNLQLTQIQPLTEQIAWPLSVEAGEPTNAPFLLWESAVLDTEESGRVLVLQGGSLQVYLFDYLWQIPLVADLRLPATPTTIIYQGEIPTPTVATPLQAKELTLHLDMGTFVHQCHLTLGLVVGGVGKNSLDLLVAYDLLALKHLPNEAPSSLLDCRLFEDLAPIQPNITGNEQIWEITWQQAANVDNTAVSLLPGMTINPVKAPGFATFTFLTDPKQALVAGRTAIPLLRLTAGFLEVLLSCQWGTFLQQVEGSSVSLDAVFGSSAGELMLGYTASWVLESTWTETYLLNGMVEICNLISWPLEPMLNAEQTTLTIPAWQPGQSLDHMRHTIRILFNQHVIPLDAINTDAGGTILELTSEKTWQFLAVVEHQLIDVHVPPDLANIVTSNDRRFTTLQEIRVLSADTFLQNLTRPGRILGDDGRFYQLSEGYGYYQEGFQATLRAQVQATMALENGAFLFVEASAPHWIRQTSLEADRQTNRSLKPSTPLQYLPSGSQLAFLNQREDFVGTVAHSDPDWLLIIMPFLGRLRSDSDDSGLTGNGSYLTPVQKDPLLYLSEAGSFENSAAQLAAHFSSRAISSSFDVPISLLDLAALRSVARLDIATLEENWFRLHHPCRETVATTIQSAMASLPDTPARLSRSTALRQLFDSLRTAYPPQMASALLPIDFTGSQMLWRQGQLLIFSGSDSGEKPFAWHLTGALLHSSESLRPGQTVDTQRFPAATLLPIESKRDQQQNPVPFSFVVSPYAGLGFLPAPAATQLQLHLVSIELLCLDPQNQLKPVTSLLREISTDGTQPLRLETYEQFAQSWGREMHKRLSPEAPVAALRLRKILRNVGVGEGQATPTSQAEAVLVTDYAFYILSDIERFALLPKRAHKLRVPVDNLTFQEGHYGSSHPPLEAALFELAPPQTTGIQPIHLETRPDPSLTWPWGYRALQVTNQTTADSKGVTGSPSGDEGPLTLWWQAPQYRVQYRSAMNTNLPAVGLPPLFRARAVSTFLPSLSTPPMPQVKRTELQDWQPVLPGSLNYLLKGNRAGAFLAIRNQLIRQQLVDEESNGPVEPPLVSGSIPVQHRMPRPVSLPPNVVGQEDSALQTWASHFEPTQTVGDAPGPADEAFWIRCGELPDMRLQLTLQTPPRGEIPEDWEGKLILDWIATVSLEIEDWDVSQWAFAVRLSRFPEAKWQVEIQANEATAVPPEENEFVSHAAQSGTITLSLVQEPLDTSNLNAPRDVGPSDIVKALGSGDLTLQIDILPLMVPGKPFEQTTYFPLKLGAERGVDLPVTPRFIYFEDPEYNRLLASLVGKSLLNVQEVNFGDKKPGDDSNPSEKIGEVVNYNVTFATDRREYTPDGRIAFRYDWDDGSAVIPGVEGKQRTAYLEIYILDPETGDEKPLYVVNEPQKQNLLIPGTLYFLALNQLTDVEENAKTRPIVVFGEGEKLRLRLMLFVNGSDDVALTHTVDIVSKSITPSPEAGYALLRKSSGAIENASVTCAQFAWSPRPSRIELVCADDLRHDVVRRRAVFQWVDIARSGVENSYAIQKIAKNGSTHFPFTTSTSM